MAEPIRPRIEEVTWGDSAGGCHWRPLDDVAIEEPSLIVSVGYVIRSDATALTLVQSINAEERPGVDNYICIPMKAVLRRRVIGTEGN